MFFIAGGTGFIGSHLIRALAEGGYSTRCLARNPEKAEICKKIGHETVIGDITNRESLKGKLNNCDIAVHLVGIIENKGDITFEKVHIEGTENFIEEAQNAKIKYIFYQSALGASTDSWSKYYKTKAEAEEIVKESGIPYTIFRPSLVIGKGDGFTEKLKELIQLGPFVPVPGNGSAKFQPIYVEDWVKCFMKIFSPPLIPPLVRGGQGGGDGSRIYEFGGPEHLTYNEIISQTMEAMEVNKPIIHLPLELIRLSLPFSGLTKAIGNLAGKQIPSVTSEQLRLLQSDNICDRDSVEKSFGFVPMTYKEALKKFIVHG
jgi:NADH dehydrogenase